MSFIECNCDRDGSKNENCDDGGKCSCKPKISGDKCNKCAKGFFGFPRCRGINFFQFLQKNYNFLFTIYFMSFIECNCDRNGSENENCDDTGKCFCKTGFVGNKCNTCAKKFFGPQCQGIFFQLFKKMLFSLYYGPLHVV